MKAMAFNGSPRRNWNTAKLLDGALAGLREEGFETERIDLRNVNFRGCFSCFSCKQKDSPLYGKCIIKDALADIIARAEEADVLLFGSPIYFSEVSSDMRALMERMIFSHFAYDAEQPGLWPRKTACGLLYTMNQPDENQYAKRLQDSVGSFCDAVFASTDVFYAVDTCQFADYSRYVCNVYDPEKKAARLAAFSEEEARAQEFGRMLARRAKEMEK